MLRTASYPLLLLVLASNVCASNNDAISNELVGFWHAVPGTPSGWAESYSFNSNGTYTYQTSQMECSIRLKSITGAWTYSNNTLTLREKRKTVLKNGRLIPSHSSCADDYMLLDATEVTEEIAPNAATSINIKSIDHDDRFEGFTKRINLNGKVYWKYSDDSEYRNKHP